MSLFSLPVFVRFLRLFFLPYYASIFFSTILSASTSYAIRCIVVTRRTNPGSSEKPLGLQKNRSTVQDTMGPIPSNAPACFETFRNFQLANAENYTFCVLCFVFCVFFSGHK